MEHALQVISRMSARLSVVLSVCPYQEGCADQKKPRMVSQPFRMYALDVFYFEHPRPTVRSRNLTCKVGHSWDSQKILWGWALRPCQGVGNRPRLPMRREIKNMRAQVCGSVISLAGIWQVLPANLAEGVTAESCGADSKA